MADSSAASSFFLLALFICGCGNALSQSVNLPGVDVLSSGFDGAALTTKFQIFDFASTPGPTVHVGANGKDYVAPAMVNVVTDGPNSKKVDASCESVAESFSDYLSTYTRSTHFSAGAEWFYYGNWKLTFDYHKDVQDVYHAITSKGQSIGVSESWWGMYEMSAPPAFLLNSKLHPFFAQSKAYLKTIGTPKTEADQLIYNQVCCGPSGFGTHYVGSLIVGGRATVQSFINNSFHSEYSKHVVDTQVSFGFEYTKLHLSLDNDAKSVHEKMMHQYLNNSDARTTFQPDSTAIDSDPAPWLAWERVAAENPTVVNTSVSSLANLFFESPEVMTHMQKTIDFYLKNGKAPTLAQANGASGGLLEAEAELESHPNPLVPGLQVSQQGEAAPVAWKGPRNVLPRQRLGFDSRPISPRFNSMLPNTDKKEE